MTEREKFEKSFERPWYFFDLTPEEQWKIDEQLGILDWIGVGLSDNDINLFKCHYLPPEKNHNEHKRDL